MLKSWAVTRGPSLDPSEKRLAVHVEDHPLDYGGFEGTIPKGEYGGGTVMLWDRGTWEPLDDPHEGLKKGKLHFRLHGERLKGGWALVRMPPRGREKRENWLLIKERDEFADDTDPLLDEIHDQRRRPAARWRRSPTAIPPSGTPTAPAAAGAEAPARTRRQQGASAVAAEISPAAACHARRGAAGGRRTGCTSSNMTATGC